MKVLDQELGKVGLSLLALTALGAGGMAMVAFAAKLPGRILSVEIAPGKGYLVHRTGWLCGTDGITPTIGLDRLVRLDDIRRRRKICWTILARL